MFPSPRPIALIAILLCSILRAPAAGASGTGQHNWPDLIGLDAPASPANGLSSVRSSILAVRAPQSPPGGARAGHTQDEYVAGRAQPVPSAPAPSPEATPKAWIASGSIIRDVALCDDMDGKGQPVNPRSLFPANTKKIGLFYRYENAPDSTDLWVIWKKNGEVVSRALRRVSGSRTALHFVYAQQDEAIAPGRYRIEFSVGDKVEATVECAVGDVASPPAPSATSPEREAVWSYYRDLERLRGALSQALRADDSSSPALPAGAADAIQTMGERYMDLAYLAHLLGPADDNGLLKARALATAGMFRASHDMLIGGRTFEESQGRAWIERAASLLGALPADRVSAFFGGGALIPARLAERLGALDRPEPPPLSPETPRADPARPQPSPSPIAPSDRYTDAPVELRVNGDALTLRLDGGWSVSDTGGDYVALAPKGVPEATLWVEWLEIKGRSLADYHAHRLEQAKQQGVSLRVGADRLVAGAPAKQYDVSGARGRPGSIEAAFILGSAFYRVTLTAPDEVLAGQRPLLESVLAGIAIGKPGATPAAGATQEGKG